MSAHRQEREAHASAALADARAAWEVELRRARGAWAAGEKARREAWAAAKEREVKELTIKARVQPPSTLQRKPSDFFRYNLLYCGARKQAICPLCSRPGRLRFQKENTGTGLGRSPRIAR